MRDAKLLKFIEKANQTKITWNKLQSITLQLRAIITNDNKRDESETTHSSYHLRSKSRIIGLIKNKKKRAKAKAKSVHYQTREK